MMRKLSFNKNYLKNKFPIKFLHKKNFFIFKIENFLDKQNYEYIKENFPYINKNKINKLNLKKNNYKFAIASKDNVYKELLVSNKHTKIIEDAFFSEKFFKYFYNNLKKFFKHSRKDDKIFLSKLNKKIVLNENLSKKKSNTFIKRQIEYSYIFNSGKIVPHTDSRYKLLSLMLYFPEFSEKNLKSYKKEKNSGTIFWNSKKKNLNNIHLEDPKIENKFSKTNKILLKVPFEKYHLYGFIRNKYSWHSVDKVNLGKNYIRKSININFYF